MYTTPLPCDITSTTVTEWQYFFFYNNSSTFKSTESSTSSTILNVYTTDARLPFLLLVMSIFNRLEISWASDRKGTVTLRNFSRNLSRNFVVPSRDKLHATLPIVKPLRNAEKKIVAVLRGLLRQVEPTSTSRNDCGAKTVARHVNFKVCYTGHFFVQLVSQQNCETSCKKDCLV